MKTNTPLTIYNKYYDQDLQKEVYQRKVIPAVMWEDRKDRNVIATGGNLAANQATIYIPFTWDLPTFLKPKAWLALADKTTNWTIQKGDILVKGELTQELGSSYTPSDLKADYDDVLSVASLDTMDLGSFALQHWKIGAQ